MPIVLRSLGWLATRRMALAPLLAMSRLRMGRVVIGLILLIINVIRDTLTGCRHPDWYPKPRNPKEHR